MGREERVEEELDGAVRVGPRDAEVAQLAEHEGARLPEDEELRARLRREEQLLDAKQLARAGGEEAVGAAEHDDEQPAEDLVPLGALQPDVQQAPLPGDARRVEEGAVAAAGRECRVGSEVRPRLAVERAPRGLPRRLQQQLVCALQQRVEGGDETVWQHRDGGVERRGVLVRQEGRLGHGQQRRPVAVRVHVLEVGHEPRPGEADRDDEWAEQEQELAVPQQKLLVRRCDLEHLPPADRLGAGPLHDSVLGEADGARDRKAGRRAASERLQAVRLQALLVHKLVGADALAWRDHPG
mmetsp:Transcript_599/g.1841  ORF Transcript_599/g.1841 Transcript_599/m.1841 type:complete len:297 (+) Transcript_599:375-1265(+)